MRRKTTFPSLLENQPEEEKKKSNQKDKNSNLFLLRFFSHTRKSCLLPYFTKLKTKLYIYIYMK